MLDPVAHKRRDVLAAGLVVSTRKPGGEARYLELPVHPLGPLRLGHLVAHEDVALARRHVANLVAGYMSTTTVLPNAGGGKPKGERVATYFASYSSGDRDHWLDDFIEQLRDEVARELGRADTTDLCFFDRTGIETGDDWETTLADEVNRASTLLALCSNYYLGSEFCSKEFEVFRQRIDLAEEQPEKPVIAILWDKLRSIDDLPPSMRVHQAHRNGASTGETVTFRNLMRLGANADLKTIEIDRLAAVIAQALKAGGPPSLPARPVFSTLGGGFQQPGDSALTVEYALLHPDGLKWQIDVAAESYATRVVNRAVEGAGLFNRYVDVFKADASFGSAGPPAVVVADADFVASGAGKTALETLRNQRSEVLVYVFGEYGPGGALARRDWAAAESKILDDLQQWVLVQRKRPAESEAADATARNRGIQVDSAPMVSAVVPGVNA